MHVGYDIIGNIAILKFGKDEKQKDKKKFSENFMKKNKSVKTVVEKVGKFSGRLRTQKTKYLSGEKTKEALCKENGCIFRLNVDTCYFSPRLSTERKEIAKKVKNENVLVMFGGIAPFAIVTSKLGKPIKVVSIEISRECSKYAKMNVKRNKIKNVEVIQGDVRIRVPQMKQKFDRIVMARPNLKNSFLDIAFLKITKNGIINYYGFYEEKNKRDLKNLILEEAKKARKKIRIQRIKKAGEIGPYKFRYRADIKILN